LRLRADSRITGETFIGVARLFTLYLKSQ
jgi:hypothetical protein